MLAAKYYSAKETPPPYQPAPATPEEHRAVIEAAAKELNELREAGSTARMDGNTHARIPRLTLRPWARYVDLKTWTWKPASARCVTRALNRATPIAPPS